MMWLMTFIEIERPLSLLALNKLIGIRTTGLNSVLIILAITVIPVVFYISG